MADPIKLASIVEERGKVYGDASINMDSLAQMFSGALEIYYQKKLPSPLPSHMAALFLSLVKIARASNDVFLQDTYDDLHNYADFAEKCHKEK